MTTAGIKARFIARIVGAMVTAAAGECLAGGAGMVPPPVAGSGGDLNTLRTDEPVSAEPGSGRVRVVVESTGRSQEVNLFLGTDFLPMYGGRAAYVSHFRTLCNTPCTFFARPGPLSLVLSADGVRPTSETVSVAAPGTRFRFRAVPAAPFDAGVALTVIGAAGLAGGVTLTGIGAADDSRACEAHGMCGAHGPTLVTWAGIASFIGGVVVIVPGIVLLATHRTSVTSSPIEAEPAPGTPAHDVPLLQRLSFDAGPLPSGGYASAALRF